ncbi:hypothetical protein RJ641_025230 [Dillenia turbinata]|uniref:Uncharacterized protein n=1 Tax=Dillenia turbinata TaxID=194707 RepID=A0AAN8WCP8_9MAGN
MKFVIFLGFIISEAVQVLVSSLVDESPRVGDASMSSLKDIATLELGILLVCFKLWHMLSLFLDKKDVDSSSMSNLAKIPTAEIVYSNQYPLPCPSLPIIILPEMEAENFPNKLSHIFYCLTLALLLAIMCPFCLDIGTKCRPAKGCFRFVCVNRFMSARPGLILLMMEEIFHLSSSHSALPAMVQILADFAPADVHSADILGNVRSVHSTIFASVLMQMIYYTRERSFNVLNVRAWQNLTVILSTLLPVVSINNDSKDHSDFSMGLKTYNEVQHCFLTVGLVYAEDLFVFADEFQNYADSTMRDDCEAHADIPSPEELIARLLVLLHDPLAREQLASQILTVLCYAAPLFPKNITLFWQDEGKRQESSEWGTVERNYIDYVGPLCKWMLPKDTRTLMLCEMMIETDSPYCEIKNMHAGINYVKSIWPSKKKEKYEQDGLTCRKLCASGFIWLVIFRQVLEVVAGCKGLGDLDQLAKALYHNTSRVFFPHDLDSAAEAILSNSQEIQ